VAVVRTGNALRLSFVKARRPLAGEIVAGRRGHLLRACGNHRRRGGDTRQCCESQPSGRRHTPPPPALGSASFFFMITLTSVGLIRSGTVQPWRSYSAMHASAKPL